MSHGQCFNLWKEHDTRLENALRRIEAAGVTLNRTKYQFGKK